MENRYQYRLSKNQKLEIAMNLIGILKNDSELSAQTKRFIGDWILTGPDEKRKAFYDVWDIVLKNYLPTTRPILFRACNRISKDGKIASFTNRLESARRFSKCKGSLIICDTQETLDFEENFYEAGKYKHTFYPLVDVFIKAKNEGGWGFSERLLNSYLGEGEYIMRINIGRMHCVKWVKNNNET